MKKNTHLSMIAIVAALALAMAASSRADSILMHFGGVAVTDSGWNNILSTNPAYVQGANNATNSGATLDLINSSGAASGVTMTIVRSFDTANLVGATSTTTSYPSNATSSSLFGNTESFNSTMNVFPSVMFSGLSPLRSYNFTFYASRLSVSDNRETDYTLAGAATNSVFLNPAGNVNSVAVLTGVVPDANGTINYTQTPGPNNVNSSHFTYLAVMQIDSSLQLITTVALSSSSNPSISGDSVVFTAAVQTNSITIGDATGNVVFKANGLPLGTNAVSGGVATITTSALPSGLNTITAEYAGDGQYFGSTNSLVGGQVVTQSGATPTIVSPPAASPISFGQTLASATLIGGVATNADAGVSVPGTFAFTTSGLAPNAGVTDAGVIFTPTSPAYASVNLNVAVTVNKTTPSLSLKASAISSGQTLANSSLSTSSAHNPFSGASVAVSFAFGTPSLMPNQLSTSVSATFTPADTADYNSVASTVTVATIPKFKKIAVVGSSTSFGTGATDYAHSYVGLYTGYLASLNPSNVVVNLAVGGYTTYEVLPTGTVNPSNRPVVNRFQNITAALATLPDAVIVNLPSNDAGNGFSELETQTNFLKLAAACLASNVPVWFTTTQPRNLGTAGQNVLMDERQWLTTNFSPRCLDFWTTVANADGSINSAYSFGDGIHLNNAGHQVLYSRVVASMLYEQVSRPRTFALQSVSDTVNLQLDTVPGISYVLESSPDLVSWLAVTNFAGAGFFDSLTAPMTNSSSFFRLRLSAAH